jgi:hypothetical protein
MSKSTRNGYLFEREVERGLELTPDLLIWKIPDGKSLGRVVPMKVPADFIISKNGRIYTIEAKQTKKERIPWTNFRLHQIEWVLQNPESAYFVVNFNNRKDINETYLVDAINLRIFQKRYPKSIPRSAFKDYCTELPRLTARFHPSNDGPFIDFGQWRLMN